MGLKVVGKMVGMVAMIRERLVRRRRERRKRGMVGLKKRKSGKRRKARKRGILRFSYPYVSVRGSGSGKMPGV
jgi:hypothetical protein